MCQHLCEGAVNLRLRPLDSPRKAGERLCPQPPESLVELRPIGEQDLRVEADNINARTLHCPQADGKGLLDLYM